MTRAAPGCNKPGTVYSVECEMGLSSHVDNVLLELILLLLPMDIISECTVQKDVSETVSLTSVKENVVY